MGKKRSQPLMPLATPALGQPFRYSMSRAPSMGALPLAWRSEYAAVPPRGEGWGSPAHGETSLRGGTLQYCRVGRRAAQVPQAQLLRGGTQPYADDALGQGLLTRRGAPEAQRIAPLQDLVRRTLGRDACRVKSISLQERQNLRAIIVSP